MKIRTVCTCPLEIVHDIMRGKWKTIIVFQLRNGGMGLAELERGIEGITQKMLLQHLWFVHIHNNFLFHLAPTSPCPETSGNFRQPSHIL